MAIVELRSVSKRYSDKGANAVADFDLRTRDGEFIVLVGPSGCGKTTTMRMIAGLELNTGGEILFDGEDVSAVPAKHRDIAMVFQSYALYPHMSVYDNMAFSLKLKKVDKAKIRERVVEAARILDIEHLLERKPRALSGGQRQRVALGRAIVREPRVFLMDEPLSNLDARLRVEMRAEIVKLHRRLKVTTFYVTHDQVEAMTMGERVVVMRDGRIQQIGRPNELYDAPVNRFVAGFIGTPSMNFLNATRRGARLEGEGCSFAPAPALLERIDDGQRLMVGVRPEHLKPARAGAGEASAARLGGRIEAIEPLGAVTLVHLRVGETSITAQLEGRPEVEIDAELILECDARSLHFFDLERERSLALPASTSARATLG